MRAPPAKGPGATRAAAAKGSIATKSARRFSQKRALEVLRQVAEALNSAATEGRAAEEALERVTDLFGIETGWVWLRDPASGRFYNAAVRNLPPYLQEPVRMTGRSCWCLDLFRKGELTARNIDVMECSRLAPAVRAGRTDQTRGLRCHASVPIYAGDRPVGILNLAMRDWRRLAPQELQLLRTIADQMGVAVERARLNEQRVEVARADERSRLARDLHDTLAQGFTAVALHIEAGIADIGRHGRARMSLQRALEVAQASLEEARRSIRRLRTAALDHRSLNEALAVLARQFTADTGIRVRTELSDVSPLPSDTEAELFHIAGEALTNVRKHANAHDVLLRLGRARGRVRLLIADDGVGFRVRSAASRGFGLAALEGRARAAGGRAIVRSTPGRGTTVSVVLDAS